MSKRLKYTKDVLAEMMGGKEREREREKERVRERETVRGYYLY